MTFAMSHLHHQLTWIVRGCLVVVGVFGIVRSIGYSPLFSPERLPRAIELITGVVPIAVYSALWFLAGLVALASAARPWPIGTIGVITLSVAWAVGYTGSWLFSLNEHVADPPNRDYLSASVYWTVALLLIGGHRLARSALTLSRGNDVNGAT